MYYYCLCYYFILLGVSVWGVGSSSTRYRTNTPHFFGEHQGLETGVHQELVIPGVSISLEGKSNAVWTFEDQVWVVVSVSHGTLEIKSRNGISAVLPETTSFTLGQKARSISFKGPIDKINRALRSLTYQGEPGYVGTDSLKVKINDEHEREVPIILSTGSHSLSELKLVIAENFIDRDILEDSIEVQVPVNMTIQSAVPASSIEAITIQVESSIGSSFSINGSGEIATFPTIQAAQDALSSALKYTPKPEWAGDDLIKVLVTQTIHDQSQDVVVAHQYFVIRVQEVDDPLSIDAPNAPLRAMQGQDMLVAPITLVDPDSKHDEILELRLQTIYGSLKMLSMKGLALVQDDSSNNNVLKVRGSASNLNQALKTLVYRCGSDVENDSMKISIDNTVEISLVIEIAPPQFGFKLVQMGPGPTSVIHISENELVNVSDLGLDIVADDEVLKQEEGNLFVTVLLHGSDGAVFRATRDLSYWVHVDGLDTDSVNITGPLDMVRDALGEFLQLAPLASWNSFQKGRALTVTVTLVGYEQRIFEIFVDPIPSKPEVRLLFDPSIKPMAVRVGVDTLHVPMAIVDPDNDDDDDETIVEVDFQTACGTTSLSPHVPIHKRGGVHVDHRRGLHIRGPLTYVNHALTALEYRVEFDSSCGSRRSFEDTVQITVFDGVLSSDVFNLTITSSAYTLPLQLVVTKDPVLIQENSDKVAISSSKQIQLKRVVDGLDSKLDDSIYTLWIKAHFGVISLAQNYPGVTAVNDESGLSLILRGSAVLLVPTLQTVLYEPMHDWNGIDEILFELRQLQPGELESKLVALKRLFVHVTSIDDAPEIAVSSKPQIGTISQIRKQQENRQWELTGKLYGFSFRDSDSKGQVTVGLYPTTSSVSSSFAITLDQRRNHGLYQLNQTHIKGTVGAINKALLDGVIKCTWTRGPSLTNELRNGTVYVAFDVSIQDDTNFVLARNIEQRYFVARDFVVNLDIVVNHESAPYPSLLASPLIMPASGAMDLPAIEIQSLYPPTMGVVMTLESSIGGLLETNHHHHRGSSRYLVLRDTIENVNAVLSTLKYHKTEELTDEHNPVDNIRIELLLTTKSTERAHADLKVYYQSSTEKNEPLLALNTSLGKNINISSSLSGVSIIGHGESIFGASNGTIHSLGLATVALEASVPYAGHSLDGLIHFGTLTGLQIVEHVVTEERESYVLYGPLEKMDKTFQSITIHSNQSCTLAIKLVQHDDDLVGIEPIVFHVNVESRNEDDMHIASTLGQFQYAGNKHVHKLVERSAVSPFELGWTFQTSQVKIAVELLVSTSHGHIVTTSPSLHFSANADRTIGKVRCDVEHVNEELEAIRVQLPNGFDSELSGETCIIGISLRYNDIVVDNFQLPVIVESSSASSGVAIEGPDTITQVHSSTVSLGMIQARSLLASNRVAEVVLSSRHGTFTFPPYIEAIVRRDDNDNTITISNIDLNTLNSALRDSSFEIIDQAQHSSDMIEIMVRLSGRSDVPQHHKISIYTPLSNQTVPKLMLPFEPIVVDEDPATPVRVDGVSLALGPAYQHKVMKVTVTMEHGSILLDTPAGNLQTQDALKCEADGNTVDCIGVGSAVDGVLRNHLLFRPKENFHGLGEIVVEVRLGLVVDDGSGSATTYREVIPVIVRSIDDPVMPVLRNQSTHKLWTPETPLGIDLVDVDDPPRVIRATIELTPKGLATVQYNREIRRLSSLSTFHENGDLTVTGHFHGVSELLRNVKVVFQKPLPEVLPGTIDVKTSLYRVDAFASSPTTLESSTSWSFLFELPRQNNINDGLKFRFNESICSKSSHPLLNISEELHLHTSEISYDSYFPVPRNRLKVRFNVRHGQLRYGQMTSMDGRLEIIDVESLAHVQEIVDNVVYIPNKAHFGIWKDGFDQQRQQYTLPTRELGKSEHDLERIDIYISFLQAQSIDAASPRLDSCFVSILPPDSTERFIIERKGSDVLTLGSLETVALIPSTRIVDVMGVSNHHRVPFTLEINASHGILKAPLDQALRLGVSVATNSLQSSLKLTSMDTNVANMVIGSMAYERRGLKWFGMDSVQFFVNDQLRDSIIVNVEQPPLSVWETTHESGYLSLPDKAFEGNLTIEVDLETDGSHISLTGLDASTTTLTERVEVGLERMDFAMSTKMGWFWLRNESDTKHANWISNMHSSEETRKMVVLDPSDVNAGSDFTVQKISTKTNINQPEIQSIAIVDTVETVNAISGSFRIAWNGHRSSTLIAHDGSASDVKEVLQQIPGVGLVDISREVNTDSSSPESYRWVITFLAETGEIPHVLEIVDPSFDRPTTSAVVEVVQEANQIGGAFKLSLQGDTTDFIPWDASPNNVKAALEQLKPLRDSNLAVQVDPVVESGKWGSRAWTVTFMFEGHVEPLEPEITFLTGTGVDVEVESVQTGDASISWGSFQFKQGDRLSHVLSIHDDLKDSSKIIAALEDIGLELSTEFKTVIHGINGHDGVTWLIDGYIPAFEIVPLTGSIKYNKKLDVKTVTKSIELKNTLLAEAGSIFADCTYFTASKTRTRETIDVKIGTMLSRLRVDIKPSDSIFQQDTDTWYRMALPKRSYVDSFVPTRLGDIALVSSPSIQETDLFEIDLSVKFGGLRVPNDLGLAIHATNGVGGSISREALFASPKTGAYATTLTFRGTKSAINSLLDDIVYVPAATKSNLAWFQAKNGIHRVMVNVVRPSTSQSWVLETTVQGGVIDGQFRLQFALNHFDDEGRITSTSTEETIDLDHDVEASVLENAIYAVPNWPERVGIKVVRSTEPTLQNGYRWSITVLQERLNVAKMTVHSHSLSSTNPSHLPLISVIPFSEGTEQVASEIGEEVKILCNNERYPAHGFQFPSTSSSFTWDFQIEPKGMDYELDKIHCKCSYSNFNVTISTLVQPVASLEDILTSKMLRVWPGKDANPQTKETNIFLVLDPQSKNVNDVVTVHCPPVSLQPIVVTANGLETPIGNFDVIKDDLVSDDMRFTCKVESYRHSAMMENNDLITVTFNGHGDMVANEKYGNMRQIVADDGILYKVGNPSISGTDDVIMTCWLSEFPFIMATSTLQVLIQPNGNMDNMYLKLESERDEIALTTIDVVTLDTLVSIEGDLLGTDTAISFEVSTQNGYLIFRGEPVDGTLLSIEQGNKKLSMYGPVSDILVSLASMVYNPGSKTTSLDLVSFSLNKKETKQLLVKVSEVKTSILSSQCTSLGKCLVHTLEDTPLALRDLHLLATSDLNLCSSGFVEVYVSAMYGAIQSTDPRAQVSSNALQWKELKLSGSDATNALNSMVYQPAKDWNGLDRISISAVCVDKANRSKSGVAGFALDFNVDVEAVSDPPIMTISGLREVPRHGIAGVLSVVDPDVSSSLFEMNLRVKYGLVKAEVYGISILQGDIWHGSKNVTVRGTLSSLNEVLSELEYVPSQEVELDHLSVHVEREIDRLGSNETVIIDVGGLGSTVSPKVSFSHYGKDNNKTKELIVALGQEKSVLAYVTPPLPLATRGTVHVTVLARIGRISIDSQVLPKGSIRVLMEASNQIAFEVPNAEDANVVLATLRYFAKPHEKNLELSRFGKNWDHLRVTCTFTQHEPVEAETLLLINVPTDLVLPRLSFNNHTTLEVGSIGFTVIDQVTFERDELSSFVDMNDELYRLEMKVSNGALSGLKGSHRLHPQGVWIYNKDDDGTLYLTGSLANIVDAIKNQFVTLSLRKDGWYSSTSQQQTLEARLHLLNDNDQIAVTGESVVVQVVRVVLPGRDVDDSSCFFSTLELMHHGNSRLLKVDESSKIPLKFELLAPLLEDYKNEVVTVKLRAAEGLGGFSVSSTGKVVSVLQKAIVLSDAPSFISDLWFVPFSDLDGWEEVTLELDSPICENTGLKAVVHVLVRSTSKRPIISGSSEFSVETGLEMLVQGITFSDDNDKDATDAYNVTFYVDKGTLRLMPHSIGKLFVSTSGSDSKIVVRGSLRHIHEANLFYTAPEETVGTANLEVTITDDDKLDTKASFPISIKERTTNSGRIVLTSSKIPSLSSDEVLHMFQKEDVVSALRIDDGFAHVNKVYKLRVTTRYKRSSLIWLVDEIMDRIEMVDKNTVRALKRDLQRVEMAYRPPPYWCGMDEIIFSLHSDIDDSVLATTILPVSILCKHIPPKLEHMEEIDRLETLEDSLVELNTIRVVDEEVAVHGCTTQEWMVQVEVESMKRHGSFSVVDYSDFPVSVTVLDESKMRKLSLIGCLDHINALFQENHVFFKPDADVSDVEDTISFSITRFQRTDESPMKVYQNLYINPVNDPPTVQRLNFGESTLYHVREDEAVELGHVRIVDVDNKPTEGYKVVISCNAGSVMIGAHDENLSVGYDSDDRKVLILRGLLTDLNHGLRHIIYRSRPDQVGIDVVHIMAYDDQSNGGTTNVQFLVDVGAVNQPPRILEKVSDAASSVVESAFLEDGSIPLHNLFEILDGDFENTLLEMELSVHAPLAQAEIQRITIERPPVVDIQVVELVASGANAATFSLKIGDSLVSGQIDRFAGDTKAREKASLLGTSMESILLAMDPTLDVEIWRTSELGLENDLSWTITFHGAPDDFPLIQVASENDPNDVIDVSTRRIHKTPEVTGSFKLEFAGRTTEPIDVNANGLDLKDKLESLPTVGFVDVTKSSSKYSWEVTFYRPSGDVPLLRAGAADTSGAARINIEEVQTGFGAPRIQRLSTRAQHVEVVQQVRVTADTGPLSGGFQLGIDLTSLGGSVAHTTLIDHDAIAKTMDEATTHKVGSHRGESMESKLNAMLAQASVGLQYRSKGHPISVSVERTDVVCERSCKYVTGREVLPLCSADWHCDFCVGRCMNGNIVQKAQCRSDEDCDVGSACSFTNGGECLTSGSPCTSQDDCTGSGSCQSKNCQLDPAGGRTWTITFHNAPSDLPMLSVFSSRLVAQSNPIVAIDFNVLRPVPLPFERGNPISGKFKLLGQDFEFDALLDGQFPGVKVIRSLPDFEYGYDWYLIHLEENLGATSLLHQKTSEILRASSLLQGKDVSISLEEVFIVSTNEKQQTSTKISVDHLGGTEVVVNEDDDLSKVRLYGTVQDMNEILTHHVRFIPRSDWIGGNVRFMGKIKDFDGAIVSTHALNVHVPFVFKGPRLVLENLKPIEVIEDSDAVLFQSMPWFRIEGRDDSEYTLKMETQHGKLWIQPRNRLLYRSMVELGETEEPGWTRPSQILSFKGILSEINDALHEAVMYRGGPNFTGVDEIRLILDPDTMLISRTLFVHVSNKNDPPLIRFANGTSHSWRIAEGTTQVQIGQSIEIGDADDKDDVEIYVSVRHGQLSLKKSTTPFTKIVMQTTRSFRVSGTVSSINDGFLKSLRYDPDQHFFGNDTALLWVGDEGGRSHSSLFNIEVYPVNDAPNIYLDNTIVSVQEDNELSLNGLFRIDDVDMRPVSLGTEQIVQTSANHVNAQQVVRVTADTGPLSGGFRLAIDLTPIGGAYAETELIDHAAVASISDETRTHEKGSDIGESMQTKLDKMLKVASVGLEEAYRGGSTIKAQVTRTDQSCDYRCTDVVGYGSVALCSQDHHCDVCVGRCMDSGTKFVRSARCFANDDCPNGGDKCVFTQGQCLSSGKPCTSGNSCSGGGICESSNCGPDPSGGYTWTITFLNAPWNLPMITVVEQDGLFAQSNPNVHVDIIMNRVPGIPRQAGNSVQGRFWLGGLDFDHDVTAEDMETQISSAMIGFEVFDTHASEFVMSKLEQSPIPGITVSRSLPDLEGGYIWTIGFHSDHLTDDEWPEDLIFPVNGAPLSEGTIVANMKQRYADPASTADVLMVNISVAHGELEIKGKEELEHSWFATSTTNLSTLASTLRQLYYRPPLNWNSKEQKIFDSITIEVTDVPAQSIMNGFTVSAKLLINVEPINDAPVISVPGMVLHAVNSTSDMLSKRVDHVLPFHVVEARKTNIHGISIRDVDAGNNGQVEVSLVAFNGTINLSPKLAVSNVKIVGTKDSDGFAPSISFMAPLSIANLAMKTLMFKSRQTGGVLGAAALVISVNDLGNSGTAANVGVSSHLTDTITLPIVVEPSTDLPIIVVPPHVLVCNEDDSLTLDATPIWIKYSNIRDDQELELVIDVAHGKVEILPASLHENLVQILEKDDDRGHLNISGTLSSLNAALANAVYTPNLHYNTMLEEPDEIKFAIRKKGWKEQEAIVTKSVFVHVNSVNDAPFIRVRGGHVENIGGDVYKTVSVDEMTVEEDDVLVVDGIHITDNDDSDEVYSLLISCEKGNLALTTDPAKGGVEVHTQSHKEIRLKGNLNRLNRAIRLIHYYGSSNWNGLDHVTINVVDLQGGSDTVAIPVMVQAVNDFPEWTLPTSPVVVEEDGTAHIQGISVHDIDVTPTQTIQVDISADTGFVSIGGQDKRRAIKLVDTLGNINVALGKLYYHPGENLDVIQSELDRIQLVANDLGHNGLGGFRVSKATIPISQIIALNDPPRILVPGARFANESVCQVSSGIVFPRVEHDASMFSLCGAIVFVETIHGVEDVPLRIKGIEVSDVDDLDRFLELSLRVLHGTLSLDNKYGSEIKFVDGSRNNHYHLHFRCKKSMCNDVLDTLIYVGNRNWNGQDYLTISVSDSSFPMLRIGGQLRDEQTIPILIQGVLDVPKWTGTPVLEHGFIAYGKEDKSIVFLNGEGASTAVQIFHPDESNQEDDAAAIDRSVLVVIYANHGTLSIDHLGRGDLVFLPEIQSKHQPLMGISANSKGSYTLAFIAPVKSANLALQRIEYTPDKDWNSIGKSSDKNTMDLIHFFVSNAEHLYESNVNDNLGPFERFGLGIEDTELYSTFAIPVWIDPINDPPSIELTVGHLGALYVDEDDSVELLNVVVVDDIDDILLTLEIVTEHGTVGIKESKDVMIQPLDVQPNLFKFQAPLDEIRRIFSQGLLEYAGAPNWHGVDQVSITVIDHAQESASLVIPIYVASVNDLPEIMLEYVNGGEAMHRLKENAFIRLANVANYRYEGFDDFVNPFPNDITNVDEEFNLWRTEVVRPGTKSGPWENGDSAFPLSWRYNKFSTSVKVDGFLVKDLAQEKIFFVGNDGEHGSELWETDGTESNTLLVKDINPGGNGSAIEYLHIHDDGKLYFSAQGKDFTWMKTDDSCSGFRTFELNETVTFGFAVSKENTFSPYESYDCPLNFHWASTEEMNALLGNPGTNALGNLYENTKARNWGPIYTDQCGWTNNVWDSTERTMFRMSDSAWTGSYVSTGQQLTGTVSIDARFRSGQGVDETNFAGIVCLKNHATNWNKCLTRKEKSCILDSGNELWVSDGTEAGTHRVFDLFRGSSGSYPKFLTSFDGDLFFSARSDTHGNELWRTDGTRQGTYMVQDIRRGAASSNPKFLTASVDASLLYFTAESDANGVELWVTDGEPLYGAPNPSIMILNQVEHGGVGTRMVLDIVPGLGSSDPSNVLPLFGTHVAFVAFDGINGRQVWISDGSSSGTGRLTMIPNAKCDPENLVFYDGVLYFSADDGVHGRELWAVGYGNMFVASRLDGSSFTVGSGDPSLAVQRLVKDILPGSQGSNPTYLTVFTPSKPAHHVSDIGQPMMIFGADRVLWKVVNHEAPVRLFQSTIKEVELAPHPFGEDTPHFVELDGTLYFAGRPPHVSDTLMAFGNKRQARPTSLENHGPVFQAFAVHDVDGDGRSYSLEIKVSHGHLKLGTHFSEGGETHGLISLQDSLGNLNRALNNLFYKSERFYNGPDQIEITIQDPDGAVVTRAIDIFVEPVNDAPIIELARNEIAIPATSNGDIKFDDGMIKVIDDADEAYTVLGQGIAPVKLEVEVSVLNGILHLEKQVGIDFISGKMEGQKSIKFVGTLEDINRVLNTLRYTPPKQLEEDMLTIHVNDNGNFGSGGPQETTANIQIKKTM